MTTNSICFDGKYYLLPFIKTLKNADDKNMKRFYREITNLLRLFISKPPQNFVDKAHSSFKFDIPKFQDINTDCNWYLSLTCQRLLIEQINIKFYTCFYAHMDALAGRIKKQDAIFLFIETYDLSEDCFDMLKKRYYRYRKMILSKKLKKIASLYIR